MRYMVKLHVGTTLGPSLMHLSPEQITRLSEWANQKKEINRLYVFGSYAKGEARNDSDLDLLLVCHSGLIDFEEKTLNYEIKEIINLHPHLTDHHRADDKLFNDIKARGYIIYSRFNDDRDFEIERQEVLDI